jgi:Sigma-70, region 4
MIDRRPVAVVRCADVTDVTTLLCGTPEMRFRFCRSIPSTSSIGCMVGSGIRATKSEREQECSVTNRIHSFAECLEGCHPFDAEEARQNLRTSALNARPEGLLELLAGRIAQLPEAPKKVLAMYYYEGLQLADIAAAFNLSKTQICQIHTEVVNELRKYTRSVWIERDRNGACANEAAAGAGERR